MTEREAKINIRFWGFIIVVSIGLFIAFVQLFFEPATKCAKGIGGLKPVLSLEFIENINQVEEIARGKDKIKAGLKTAQLIDSFVIVPFYVALLLLMSRFLALAEKSWLKTKILDVSLAKLLALTAAVCSVLGGIGDLVENYFSYRILNLAKSEYQGNEWLTTVIRYSSHIKFVLIFTAISILSLVFWRFTFSENDENKLRKIFRVGLLTILGAALFMLGILGDYATLADHRLINFAMTRAYLGILIAGFLFIWLNRDFLKDF